IVCYRRPVIEYPMARGLLTLLLTLPLLAPPGVCLCGGDAREPISSKIRQSKPAKKCCSSCGRCHSTEPQAAPAPERHEREGPAAFCASVVEKWNVSPRGALDVDFTPDSFLTLAATVVPVTPTGNDAPPPITSPPLYLAHQSFVI